MNASIEVVAQVKPQTPHLAVWDNIQRFWCQMRLRLWWVNVSGFQWGHASVFKPSVIKLSLFSCRLTLRINIVIVCGNLFLVMLYTRTTTLMYSDDRFRLQLTVQPSVWTRSPESAKYPYIFFIVTVFHTTLHHAELIESRLLSRSIIADIVKDKH